MKNLLFLISFILLLHSCKKEEKYNPDEHITYTHWYKLKSSSVDTLYSVYLPNAFTPGIPDGTNDIFIPKGNYILSSLKVYDKYGHVIFVTVDENKGWGGRVNGSSGLVQMNSYDYQLKVKDALGVDYEYTGIVMLYK